MAFVVPANRCQALLDGCHREAGHQGRDRTLSLLREHFWWPRMAVQAVLCVKNCTKCRRFEAREKLPEMVTIGTTEPLDLVHIDFAGMETTVATRQKPVVKTVLVVVDHFTRFIRAFVLTTARQKPWLRHCMTGTSQFLGFRDVLCWIMPQNL